MTEKEKIQAAAVLCEKRNNLTKQIAYQESQLKNEIDVENQLNIDAAKYAKTENRLSKVIGFLRKLGLGLLLPCIPLAIVLACFKLNLYMDFFEAHGEWISISVVLLTVVGWIIATVLDKNKYKRRVKNFKKNNIKAYEMKRDEVHTYNENIKAEIHRIKAKKIALEQQMSDRTICCIHPDYWYAGPQLFYLIDTGRADTLKEAINLFENIKENERRRLAEEAAAEERHWAKFEEMMEENEKLDKLKRTIRSAMYDIF